MKVCTTYRVDPAVPEDTETPVDVALEITCLELDAVTVTDRVEDASFVKPLAPVNDDAWTCIDPVPASTPAAVKVTVRVVPEVVRLDSEPRVTVKSDSVRSVTLSLSSTVIVQVCPTEYEDAHPLNVAVGREVHWA